MDDREVVAAIVAGDPMGLAEAYDRYAARLYTYCRSLLREPADAEAAVQETFVVAQARLAGLSDSSRLRPWLYAVARNECRRRIRANAAVSGNTLDEPASGDAAPAELQELLHAAIAGLSPGEREAIELSLRHGLEGADLADVLGVTRKRAHALSSRARDQLRGAFGPVLAARTGRQSCPDLDAMLADWDGTLTELLRKRVSRHIEGCQVCGERNRSELRPALASLLPLATPPAGFWQETLRICADDQPDGIAHRASIVNRTGWFSRSGFPTPLDPPKAAEWWRSGRVHVASATAAAAAIAIAAALTLTGARHNSPSAATGPAAASSAKSSSDGSARLASPSPGADTPAAPVGGDGTPGSPSAARSGATRAPGSSRSPSSSSSASSASSSPSPPPGSQGTLNVTPAVLALTSVAGGGATGTLTLSAQNGPVPRYLIRTPVLLIGSLTVSPSSGSLAPGQSVQVTVTLRGHLTFNRLIRVNPGGQIVRVVYGIALAAGQRT